MARKSRKSIVASNNTASCEHKVTAFRAGLYARLSHEKEENVERGTIETQMELMKNYVKDKNDIVVVDEYFDASFTGTNMDRPDFQRLLEDAKSGKINCIITKDLSRLGRDYIEMGNLIERVFPFLNVRYIAVTDDFDSFRPGTDLMMPLKNIVNEFYAKDISKKIISAKRAKWDTDEYACGVAPYGYKKSDTKKNFLEINEETAEIVREIFDLFLEGKGYTTIARLLNKRGVLSPAQYLKSVGKYPNDKRDGMIWHKLTVKHILLNQAYIGHAVHGKTVVEKCNNIPSHATDPSEWIIRENVHEAIIDSVTFEKAQKRVQEISEAYANRNYRKQPLSKTNILKGKIVCGDCGKTMRLDPRKTVSDVYICGGWHDAGKDATCTNHKISQDDVNAAVFNQISSHMRICVDTVKVIRELNARSNGLRKYDVYEKAITKQRRELEKVNKKFSELYSDYADRLITESEYLQLKQQYLDKSEYLKLEIDNLLMAQNTYSRSYKINADWEQLVHKYLHCRKLNKEMVDAFVDRVLIYEEGRIEVKLVYDDCLQELMDIKKDREEVA